MRLLRCQFADAEDAVSITLLSAMQQLSRASSPIVNERAWLSRILYNVCMDMHRHRRRFSEPVSSDGQDLVEDGLHATIQDLGPSPEQLLLAREQSQALNSLIQTLPPTLRVPFVMRFHQDMPYPEIAARLRLTNCNVRKRIQFAYSHLRKSCAETS